MTNDNEQLLTTKWLDALVRQINQVHRAWCRWAGNEKSERAVAHHWRAEAVREIHRCMKPTTRPYAGRAVATVLEQTLEQFEVCLDVLNDLATAMQESPGIRQRHEIAALQGKIALLQSSNAALQRRVEAAEAACAEWRERALVAAPASVTIPAQTVTVRSKVDREILRLIATTGLARSWHVITRIVADGLTEHENGVRNAIKRLKEAELLVDFMWNGKPQQWTPRAGGGRQLLMLTERGRIWAEMAFQIQAVPCELDALVQRHKGVEHAVGILEARDFLAASGFEVEMEPRPRPFDEGERFGARTEPDLLATVGGVSWPVEVQREVHERNGDKWRKALELYGRLMLVVFSEQAREKQVALLRSEMARWDWPAGTIWVGSLEAFERGGSWTVLEH